jgi:hypothetical protein
MSTLSDDELNKWANEQRVKIEKEHPITDIKYWTLVKKYYVLIERDRDWFESVYKKINDAWDKIEYYKNNKNVLSIKGNCLRNSTKKIIKPDTNLKYSSDDFININTNLKYNSDDFIKPDTNLKYNSDDFINSDTNLKYSSDDFIKPITI